MDNLEMEFFAFVAILISLFLSFLILKIELDSLERNIEKLKQSISAATAPKPKSKPSKKQQTAKAVKRVVRPTKKGKSNG